MNCFSLLTAPKKYLKSTYIRYRKTTNCYYIDTGPGDHWLFILSVHPLIFKLLTANCSTVLYMAFIDCLSKKLKSFNFKAPKLNFFGGGGGVFFIPDLSGAALHD